MEKENKYIKWALILQSFTPLFILLAVKHVNFRILYLVSRFFELLSSIGIKAFKIAFLHDQFSDVFFSVVCFIWFILTIAIALAFKGIQDNGFISAGENVIISESTDENSASFLVTYVSPLLIDDSKPRELIMLIILLIMIIVLLSKSNSFYQNPVLSFLNYKIFEFEFVNPAPDITKPGKTYIGITRQDAVSEESTIKRKHISGGVFLIYND